MNAWLRAAVATATADLVWRGGRSLPALQRRNYSGQAVSLAEGPALAAGMASGSVLMGPAAGAPLLASAVGAGLLGLLDDLAGTAGDKGLQGHLRALHEGRVTTGMIKVVGLPVVALVGARLGHPSLAQAVLPAAVIAVSANVINLLDTFPGRALKVGGALLAALAAGERGSRELVALTAGPALRLSAPDLAARGMLGDCGANALGAALGTIATQELSTRSQQRLLLALIVVTLASERVSFSQVIERTAWLRAIDGWGRATAEPGT